MACFFRSLYWPLGFVRQPVASAFLPFRQIHTLSTPAALSHLQDLVRSRCNMDALICSSTAGRSVVSFLCSRAVRCLAERQGGVAVRLRHQGLNFQLFHCLPDSAMAVPALDKRASICFGSSRDSISRACLVDCRSIPSSIHNDPSAILERVAKRLQLHLCLSADPMTSHPRRHPCGPCAYAVHVHFKRLGGAEPVSEELKRRALFVQLMLPYSQSTTLRKPRPGHCRSYGGRFARDCIQLERLPRSGTSRC